MSEATRTPTTGKIIWQPSTPAIGSNQLAKTNNESAEGTEQETTEDLSVVQLIKAKCKFFHTPDGTAYATIILASRSENLKINSPGFRKFCTKEIYVHTGEPPMKKDLNRLIALYEAEAIFDSPVYPVHMRLARHDGCVYIDLANDKAGVVKISAKGWSLKTAEDVAGEVKFVRTSRMAPLPIPLKGGSLEKLRGHLSIASEDEFILFVSWVVGANQPDGPYPILLLHGEHGSGKSNIARKAVDLIDPSIMPLCSHPRSERDLCIAAAQTRVLSFDNLSSIPQSLSDAFCRMSTGGGFATRRLYSDDEEKVFNFKRPVIINGISDLIGRHDFSDRAIFIGTELISSKDRLPEDVLRKRWQEDRPGIFGALCDAISTALRDYDKVQMEHYPRMADFSQWVCAAEKSLPWEEGVFTKAYSQNRADIVEIGLEADLVGSAVIAFMANKDGWAGKPSNLLTALNANTPDNIKRLKDWPKQPNIMSGKLRRAATFLRETGIDIERRKSGDRKIVISRLGDTAQARAWKVDMVNTNGQSVRGASPIDETVINASSGLASNADQKVESGVV